ncbi:hypothetical protein Dimus_006019 [Dionaea muscipula]
MHLVDRSGQGVRWIGGGKEGFSVRGAYLALKERVDSHPWWRFIWASGLLPRNAFILWLVCRNRVRTRDRLASWGIVEDTTWSAGGMSPIGGVDPTDKGLGACVALDDQGL